MNKKITVALIIMSILTCLVLGACDSGSQPESSSPAEPKDVSYKVTVKDALGEVITSGVIVHFVKDGQTVAMQPVNDQGEAVKILKSDNYTAEIKFTDESASYYVEGDLALTADRFEAEATVSKKITSEASELIVTDNAYDAYSVEEGCTYIKLTKANRNYFLFVPKTAGLYEFAIKGNEKAVIGYYGAPHFVQSTSTVEVTDGKFQISVSASMIGTGEGGTSTYVIGIDLTEGDKDDCVLTIKRVGDPIKTIEDEPWTVYKTTVELKEYDLPVGATLGEFDLTASTDTYSLVFNEEDGFYHLDNANGPLVLVRLAEDCDYIACFQTMLDRSGVTRYFFDENGDFVKKENYSECLSEYIQCVDLNEGVYPLTEDLKYIIQQRGEYVGWWNPESQSYIFKDMDGNKLTDINNDIAWLLMCCYIENGGN
ncbi:MAG: hypothetical protein IKY21_05500 [Clostridia bacterium]|nr:hypothetical protein [Clostridia bacterium]